MSTLQLNKQFRPLVEALESRDVMSVTNVYMSGSTLVVLANGLNDNISIMTSGANIRVIDNAPGGGLSSKSYYKASAPVTKISVYTYGGNDRVVNHVAKSAYLVGGIGNDYLYGDNANDTIFGQEGNDTLLGDTGADLIYGGANNDTIYGHAGSDQMHGETGNDYLIGGADTDRFLGGSGFDKYRDDFNMNAPVYNGSSMYDVNQGSSPTCSVNSVMASAANHGISWASKIANQGNNWFTVKMWNNGVNYDRWVYFDGSWTDDDSQLTYRSGWVTGDFWNVLGQRAFLQSYGIDWTKPSSTWDDSTTAWQVAGNAMDRLHGSSNSLTWVGSNPGGAWNELVKANNGGQMVVAGTYNTVAAGSGLVGWHAYTVLSAYYSNGDWYVQLRNPWGYNPNNQNDLGVITVNWATFTANFNFVFSRANV